MIINRSKIIAAPFLLFFVFWSIILMGQTKKIPLLCPRKNFEKKIIDSVFGYFNSRQKNTILLRIQKNKDSTSSVGVGVYQIRLTTLAEDDLYNLLLKKDKYYGFFEYKKHTVLVYGPSEDPGYFFSRLKPTKTFTLRNAYQGGFDNEPPVNIEPTVFIFNYNKDRFLFVLSGMFSFWE